MATRWPARRTSTCARRTSSRRRPRTHSAACADGGSRKSQVARLKSQVSRRRICVAGLFLTILLTMSAFEAIGEFEHVVLLAVLRLGDDAYAVPIRDEI